MSQSSVDFYVLAASAAAGLGALLKWFMSQIEKRDALIVSLFQEQRRSLDRNSDRVSDNTAAIVDSTVVAKDRAKEQGP